MSKLTTGLVTVGIVGAAAFTFLQPAASAEAMRVVPAPVVDEVRPAKPATEVAVLAGGCFWGLEGVFEHVAGVKDVVSGYAGGGASTAHYEIVGSGLTGHAESVRITYDPAKVSFGQLLRVYFSVATDPTELNRQGPDTGSQYRGTVFAQTPEQVRIAKAYIAQLKPAFAKPVVTTIETGKAFYPAEAYHQDFLNRNPDYPYIVVNDMPKVTALKRLFPALYKG
ncbi:peptide-methionine (S)-S-oxide reductase MsrA [Sphingosinicellaceae bacterium]|nr:peptide-methionine (S)-S-oxide reductase MsrA [Sphingosinicellaceae bacterium]